MSQVVYRANLSSATWPFVSTLFGRTVIVPGPDQNFIRQLYSENDADKDIGVPQSYYMHNVMPSAQGYQSIGYELQNSRPAASLNVNNVRLAIAEDGTKSFLGTSDLGIVAFQNPDKVFRVVLPLSEFQQNAELTTATINGITYFNVARLGCYIYEPNFGTVTPVVLTGLDPTLVLGILASDGYMIAYTEDQIVWSSTIDATDFVPSLLTGAGGGAVQDLRGKITAVVKTSYGILAATTLNCVSATYSGNAQLPYNYTEVAGSGGVASSDYIAFDTNTGANFAYTTFGIQLLAPTKAETIFPECTDFLAGQIFEDYNETTGEFSYTTGGAAFLKKLVLISGRYLVISYGISSLTHALVYDVAYKRWGKLKITHSDCFEFSILDQVVSDSPKKSIGFVTTNGIVSTVNFNQYSTDRNGVMMCGKYQYVRSRFLGIDLIEPESILPSFAFNTYLYSTLDGKNFLPRKELAAREVSELSRVYYGESTQGMNHSILFTGAWSMDCIVLTMHIGGKTR